MVDGPRKVPQQERSRRMYERILDAAARVLVASGYDGASTHRIADEAGVSPGSVYQYFPNKDVIIRLAVERMAARVGRDLTDAVAGTDLRDPAAAVRGVVAAVLATTEEHRELARVLVEQLPRLGGTAAVPALERHVVDQAHGFLLGLRAGGDPVRAAADAWIAVQAIQQLVTRYVLDPPPIPRAVFVDGLARLVSGFLGLDPPPAVPDAQPAGG